MKKTVVISIVASVVLFCGLAAMQYRDVIRRGFGQQRPGAAGREQLLEQLLGFSVVKIGGKEIRKGGALLGYQGGEEIRVRGTLLGDMELFNAERNSLGRGFVTGISGGPGGWTWDVTQAVRDSVGEEAWNQNMQQIIEDVQRFFHVANADAEPEGEELLMLFHWANVFQYGRLQGTLCSRLLVDVEPQRVRRLVLDNSEDFVLQEISRAQKFAGCLRRCKICTLYKS